MTKQDYILQYPNAPLISESTKAKLQHCLSLMYENQEWERYSSSYEEIIINFLHEQNVEIIEHDRTILKPLELDVYLPQQRVGIEINGNKWHTEWFGQKRPNYHLEKTKLCNEQNINLIHIFEDEIILKKEIVLNKIQHIIGCQMNLPKIMGRKCEIEEIDKEIAEYFLNDYHIQGYCPSTKHLGAIWEGRLIAVMSFKEEKKNSSEWELTRFASDFHFICQGVGGKLFQRFIKMFNPLKIKSFADRRWTLTPHDNLYIKLGFQLDGFVKPDYKYFNPSVDKVRRFHKFNFRKHILSKKYGLDANLTETEMVKMLGYDRIWDCGLIRYVWKKKEV